MWNKPTYINSGFGSYASNYANLDHPLLLKMFFNFKF